MICLPSLCIIISPIFLENLHAYEATTIIITKGIIIEGICF